MFSMVCLLKKSFPVCFDPQDINLNCRTFTRRPKENLFFFYMSLSHNFPPTNIELHWLGQTEQPAHGFTGVCSKQTDTIRFVQ